MNRTIVLLSLSFSLALALNAAETVRYESQPGGGKITLEGKSTAGAWTMECAAIGGFIEADAAFPESIGGKPKIEVNVPVRQIKSGKKAMDARMLSEMNQPVHPRVEYRVLELKPKGAPAGGKAEFDATGTLTIIGVTRTNTMPVTITRVDKTKLKVNGTTIVKMTDHGLKPPTFDVPVLGGLMKTDDEVKITFEWSPEVEKK
jgi:polyisoprenoid-binding protein YceI